MTSAEILQQRLLNQRIAHTKFEQPIQVVEWLGAVQAQEYAGAKWAIGMRLKESNEAMLDQALDDGSILRTHVMRPTWHFVAPADIKWMQELTAQRVRQLATPWFRKMGLDDTVLKKCNTILSKELSGGKQLTRQELAQALQLANIPTDDMRSGFIMMNAELDALVCSGGRRGKQFTYMLLDERAPKAKSLPYEQALAELTRRYYTAHGPATVQDFVWWSGLTVAQAKLGIDMIKSELMHVVSEGQTYWFSEWVSPPQQSLSNIFMLPTYDEYVVGYRNRENLVEPHYTAPKNVVFIPAIVIDGKIMASWKRSLKKNSVTIEVEPFTKLSSHHKHHINITVENYAKFMGLSAQLPF